MHRRVPYNSERPNATMYICMFTVIDHIRTYYTKYLTLCGCHGEDLFQRAHLSFFLSRTVDTFSYLTHSSPTMVKTIVQNLADSLSSFMEFMPPGVVMSLLTAYIGEGKYLEAFRQEFVGTLLMIVCTFSAGKWVGKDSMYTAWGAHAMGVITADYFGGGPHVNPAVTTGMWSLGKVSHPWRHSVPKSWSLFSLTHRLLVACLGLVHGRIRAHSCPAGWWSRGFSLVPRRLRSHGNGAFWRPRIQYP